MRWLFHEERSLAEYAGLWGILIVVGLICVCILLLARAARQSTVSNAVSTAALAQARPVATTSATAPPDASPGPSAGMPAPTSEAPSSEDLKSASASEQIAGETARLVTKDPANAASAGRVGGHPKERAPHHMASKPTLHRRFASFQSRSRTSFKALLTMWHRITGRDQRGTNSSR
jgi:outer membrane autotransporter protein